MSFSDLDKRELQVAKNLLENPGLAARMTDIVGAQIEKGLDYLPDGWSENIGEVTQTALMKASEVAVFTMKDIPGEESSNTWHKLGVAVSGGVGGFFGIGAVAVELPISTSIMLRSIADIARSEGESISEFETKLACLEVFGLGGKSKADDGAETGYFAVRTVLAKSVSETAEYFAKKGITKESAPILAKFITQISKRFGVQVTQKAAAQAVPAIGAAGGAIINCLFIDHFQDIARGHFIVRKLERKHGTEEVQKLYESIPSSNI